MEISFFNAKNGQLTAASDKLFLHSNYNPENEAKRFVNNLNFSFKPKNIVITEPALSYCIPFLKDKYPESKIFCIRYDSCFSNTNSYFEKIFNYFELKDFFETEFFNNFGEMELLKTAFIKWEPASKIYTEEDICVWKSIKNSIEKARTLLVTRENFEKKWLLNSINLIKNSKKFYSLPTSTKPVLIIASGPSLKPLLSEINKIKNNFFIIALSSAISALKKFNIEPDLYFSTDGGYWAGQHLKKLKNEKIPLAITTEAFCPKEILLSNKIIPLFYGDEIIADYIKNNSTSELKSVLRNGTISGTALSLAKLISDKEIYYTGLDLSNNKKLSHIKPNENEINSSLKDNKLRSTEKRHSSVITNNYALDLYRDWFANLKDAKKIFRIIDEDYKSNDLGNIKDITVSEFKNIYQNFQEGINTPSNIVSDLITFNSEKLKSEITHKIFSDKGTEQLFPLNSIKLSHDLSNNQLRDELKLKQDLLINKINRILK